MDKSISVWEGEGGALSRDCLSQMSGTVNQIAWARQIRLHVDAEFDRVAAALEVAAGNQSSQDRLDTRMMICILEEKRAEVMANTRAGYFIHDWQDLRDQVRKLILKDDRYKTIQAEKLRRQVNPSDVRAR